MAIEKLSVILELVSGNYKKEARDAANATGAIGNSAKSVTGSLGAMLGPAAIGGAIVGLGKMALAAGENADRLFDLQAQTGLSTDALQEWEFVAKAAGATTEVFSDAVKAIIKNLDGTAGATGAAAKAYTALGISVKDANGNLREGGEITEEVFEKLAGMTNITERNALAQDLFGKKWEETISILDLGTEALGNLRTEGAKGVISPQALAQSDKFRETWQKFTATIGPKLNEILGRISPLLTEVADGALEAVDAMQPLIDAIGFLADRYGDLRGGLDELEASDNNFLSFLGTAGNIITGFGGGIGALATGIGTLTDETEANVEVSNEAHDSWTAAAAAEIALRSSLGPTIALLDNQYASHRNVAAAADSQRTALINLATYQRSQLSPISNFISLQEQLATAQETLATAQANGKTPASELALAQIAVVDAMLALSEAGLSLNPEEVAAFAQRLVTEFGYSEKAAQDLLEQLGLFDGFVVNAKVIVTMDTVTSGTTGIKGTGNINSLTDLQNLDSGGIVRGRLGEPSLVIAHGGELVTPPGKAMGKSVTINVARPMDNFRQDLQYATILASVTNLVEGF